MATNGSELLGNIFHFLILFISLTQNNKEESHTSFEDHNSSNSFMPHSGQYTISAFYIYVNEYT